MADRYEVKKTPKQKSDEEEAASDDDPIADNEEEELDNEEEEAELDNEEEELDNEEEEPKGQKKGNKKKVSRVLNFRFIDSLAFMNTSLESLVKNLKGSGLENFKIKT